jgi:hypothetical protein
VRIAFGVLGLALLTAACAPPAPKGCVVGVVRDVAFTGAQTSDGASGDTVEAASSGPNCSQAVFTMTVRAPDGAAIWAYAAPAVWIYPELAAMGELSASHDAVEAALTRWATISVSTTASQPNWGPMSAQPGEPSVAEAQAAGIEGAADPGAGPWHTPLDPATYRDVRARALPMACFETGPESAQCVYWEPALGHAAAFVEFRR